MSTQKSLIRIANAGGYWGDDPYALRRQVFGELNIDFISMDFLAEITMSILQKQKAKDPKAGYAKDFIIALDSVFEECLSRNIKMITNAGGVNPKACAQAVLELAKKKNINVRVAVVDGDDIFSNIEELHKGGISFKNMETGEDFLSCKDQLSCANAYFGALPIVEALKQDPHIVICGRVTDTSITLAPMIASFGWEMTDYHKMAHGIIAGHIIECGAQTSGGNFTDWKKVASFIDIGFPIVECMPDGTFYVTKHPHTGGLISAQTVREQLLYEMGTPHAYITPDVIADFSSIALEQVGENRVKVSGIRGSTPTDLDRKSVV